MGTHKAPQEGQEEIVDAAQYLWDNHDEIRVEVKDGAGLEHVGVAFCTPCFKSTIHYLSNDKKLTLCRECGVRRPVLNVVVKG